MTEEERILRELYIEQQLTMKQVGKVLRVDRTTVSRRLAAYGIPRRGTGRQRKTETV